MSKLDLDSNSPEKLPTFLVSMGTAYRLPMQSEEGFPGVRSIGHVRLESFPPNCERLGIAGCNYDFKSSCT